MYKQRINLIHRELGIPAFGIEKGENGMFTAPDITVQGMIEKCVSIIARRKVMPEEQARALMNKAIPDLKRWEKTPSQSFMSS